MRREEKSKTPNLKRQFLKTLDHQAWHDTYQQTKDPILLEKLNSAYSDFVNYTVILSLIQTNIKYKSLHVRERLYQNTQELVSEEKWEYTLDQQQSPLLPLKIDQWGAVLENEELLNAVSTLTERQQHVLWLLFIDGLQATEVRKQLDVSIQAVSKTKQRALTKIKQQLLEG